MPDPDLPAVLLTAVKLLRKATEMQIVDVCFVHLGICRICAARRSYASFRSQRSARSRIWYVLRSRMNFISNSIILDLHKDDASVLVADPQGLQYFNAVSQGRNPKIVSNWYG